MTHQIKQVFDQQALLNDHEWELFNSKLETKVLKKGDFLLNEGEVENYLTFIVKGTVRYFTYNKKGEEISIAFSSENNFCSSYGSFVSRKPSVMSIQALEDMIVMRISNQDLNALYSISHTGERLGRINAELYLIHSEEREVTLLTMDASERYIHLMDNHPKLLQLVKQEHIATYLGVTPQSLSRIRKQLSKS